MDWLISLAAETQGRLYANATGQLQALSENFGFASVAGVALTAVLFGAVHALMPGHGKIMLVSYHGAQPGRVRDAIVTSSILALTHVGSAVLIVLGGFMVLQRTLGSAGRSAALEIASAIFVFLIGAWILFRALRGHGHDHAHRGDGRILAFATGLVPCPLTAFIMIFASAKGFVASGLVMVCAMAAGMIFTIGLFAVGATLFRRQAIGLQHKRQGWRGRATWLLEIAGALALIALGLFMLAKG
jgi:nickel/cobalt exporter